MLLSLSLYTTRKRGGIVILYRVSDKLINSLYANIPLDQQKRAILLYGAELTLSTFFSSCSIITISFLLGDIRIGLVFLGLFICTRLFVVEGLLSNQVFDNVDEQTICDFHTLQECGYLLPSKIQFIEHPLTAFSKYKLERSIGHLILQITRNCNLRCKYCVYSETKNLMQRHHSSEVMTIDVAKRALLFYRNHVIDTDTVVIGFYGGEPLLEFKLIRQIVDISETLFNGKKILYSITTNATLLTDEVIDYLSKRNFHVVFSVDGPESIHDRNRLFANGTGSFRKVMQNIEKYREKKAEGNGNTTINTVIDPHLQYQQMASLLETPFLKEIEVTASPIEQDGVQLPISSEFTKEYNYQMFLSLVSFFRSSAPTYANGFLRKEITGINQGNDKIQKTDVAQITSPGGPCIPGKPRLFVDCFGNMYPCEKTNENDVMKIGNIYSGFDYSKIYDLMNIGKLSAEKCKDCWAFSLCNICAKHADSGNCLSGEKKCEYCDASKNNAYTMILHKILTYENSEHKREMRRQGVYVT